MIQSILSSDFREKAGSTAYDRFEYQVHWIVYHMINEYKNGREFFIFCEFHDDMAKSNCASSDPECMEFFQIKTSDTMNEWKLDKLLNTKELKTKTKHSFLGFIFLNFMKFDSECSKCHFVSNIEMELSIREWQAVLEDGKVLKDEEFDLYNKIKDKIKVEYSDLTPEKFNEIFDKFIQNTYIYYGDLPLKDYEKIVNGEFFSLLRNEDICASTGYMILREVIEDVRKKSKRKVSMPISYDALKKAKGLSSDVFKVVKQEIDTVSSRRKRNGSITAYLNSQGYSEVRCNLLLKKLEWHDFKKLDILNTLYQDSIAKVHEIINITVEENYGMIDDFNFIKDLVIRQCQGASPRCEDINDILVEAILCERLLC